ncbi:MAG: helix-turn-helix domain-containing protein [Candidatus Obscuribacterales bacterium]|nr:helix-turn-helix domain-containing protein [Candidatus Obscuribacterales bacterium]
MKLNTKLTLSDQLRREIRNSGLSAYAIARLIEIDKAAMSRFLNGKSGISLDAIDRLGQLLGLWLEKKQVAGPKDHRFSTVPGFVNSHGQRVKERTIAGRSKIAKLSIK